MRFHRHFYRVMIVLGNPAHRHLWLRDVAVPLVGEIEAKLRSSRGKSAIRVNQTNGKKYEKYEKYGKLSLDEKSTLKWAHGDCDERLFGSVQICSPVWGTCEREDMAPDGFVYIGNECASRSFSRPPKFNPLAVICTRHGCELDIDHEGIVNAIHARTGGRGFASDRMAWGRGNADDTSFTGSLQDLAKVDLFRPGNPHGREIGPDLFNQGHDFHEAILG